MLVVAETVEPFLKLLGHESLNSRVTVAEMRVEQTLEDLIAHHPRIQRSIVPRLDNLFNGKLDNDLGDLSCRFVQDEPKVILGKETVGGVRSVRIMPDFLLILGRNDFGASLGQPVGGSLDDGFHVRLKGRQDKY